MDIVILREGLAMISLETSMENILNSAQIISFILELLTIQKIST